MTRYDFFVGIAAVNVTIAECAGREWLATIWVVAALLFAIQATVAHLAARSGDDDLLSGE